MEVLHFESVLIKSLFFFPSFKNKADTPLSKSGLNRDTSSARGIRSAIVKNRVDTASFVRHSPSLHSNKHTPMSRSSSSINTVARCKAASSLNIVKESSYSIDSNYHTNKVFTHLEKSPVKIQKFAEDLLNYHARKGLSDRSSVNSNKPEELPGKQIRTIDNWF